MIQTTWTSTRSNGPTLQYMSTNKCPKCENSVTQLSITIVPGETKKRSGFECVLYSCPSCHTVLSAGIDPVLLANQIITALKP